jgi:hypothetical protein
MTAPRDFIQRLANALHDAADDVEGWGNYASSYFQEKHDLLGNVARIHAMADEAFAYLAQPEPEVPTDEIYGGPGAVVGSDDICLAKLAAQYGADQELEACCEYLVRCAQWEPEDVDELRAARRTKPATLKEQSLKHLEVMERDGHYLPEILQDLRRAVEQLDG